MRAPTRRNSQTIHINRGREAVAGLPPEWLHQQADRGAWPHHYDGFPGGDEV